METLGLIQYAEENKDKLPLSELRQLANTLHSRMRVMPPDQWKRVEAIEAYIRNKFAKL